MGDNVKRGGTAGFQDIYFIFLYLNLLLIIIKSI
jgi:hypothetical protein